MRRTTRYLVSTDHIVSLHTADHGPVARVRCPEGFADADTRRAAEVA